MLLLASSTGACAVGATHTVVLRLGSAFAGLLREQSSCLCNVFLVVLQFAKCVFLLLGLGRSGCPVHLQLGGLARAVYFVSEEAFSFWSDACVVAGLKQKILEEN